jgi:hypothetical protein
MASKRSALFRSSAQVFKVQLVGDGSLSRRFLASSGEPGSFEHVETPRRLEPLPQRKVGTETTRRRISTAAIPPSFDERKVVLLPALFTRSRCFHQELSTTSSATHATKSL